MNSQAHHYIARKGFELLPDVIRREWKKGKHFIFKTCMYPDIFADRGLSAEEKKRIDPEFEDVYLEPAAPREAWYLELVKKLDNTPKSVLSEILPERGVYLYKYYMEKTVEYLKKGDKEKAARFAGILSHYIGDIAQPIHLVNPMVLDLLIKCPDEFLSFELHAGIEGITGKPVIKEYKPNILGNNLSVAVMGLYKKILLMAEECRYTTLLMVKAIYSHRQEQAVKIAGISVKLATCVFSDFLRTSWALAYGEKIPFKPFCLTDYPYIHSTVDMLYRYRPMKNLSLIPYSGGKSYPLTLLDRNGKHIRVQGLGVIPFLGPKKSFLRTVRERDARVEFLLWPGAYRRFRTIVGLNPLFKESKGKVVFRVFVDGKLAGKSKVFSPREPAEELNVNLPRTTHFLTLSMLTMEEPPAPLVKTHPHGVWADPTLE